MLPILVMALAFSLLSIGATNEVILERDFGMKIFCLSGLNTTIANLNCDKNCIRDSYTSNPSVSNTLINNGQAGLSITVNIDTININYSYILVEIEQFTMSVASVSTGTNRRQLTAATTTPTAQFQFADTNESPRFPGIDPIICNFSGTYDTVILTHTQKKFMKSTDTQLSFSFDSIDAVLNSNNKYMTKFTITSVCVINCKVCNQDLSCAECLDGFQKITLDGINTEVCEQIGISGIPNCFKFIPGMTPSTCISCLPGFTLDSNSCIQNTSTLATCLSGTQYLENDTCFEFASKGYYETDVDGVFTEIIQYTPQQIQMNYQCPYGTLAFFNRLGNYQQYSCRCLIKNCFKCSSINICNKCSQGFKFDASQSLCILAPVNSFSLNQTLTDSGYEIRVIFKDSLLNQQLTETDLEVSISDFQQFKSSFISVENPQTVHLQIEMFAKAKNKQITVSFKNSNFVIDNFLEKPDATTQLQPFLQIQSSDKEAAETAKSVGQAASGAIVGTLLIIVIISNFSAIVATIDLTGFLYYLLYIEARFPINIVEFYAVFKNFQMDFIPNPFSSLATQGYMQLSSVRFMQSDTDGYFLASTGQSVVIFLLIVLMYIIAKILSKVDIPLISNYFKKSVYETWEYGGYFDAVWTVYLYLMIGVMMQFQSFDCSDSSCGWNYFIFSISFIVSFGVPVLIFKLLRDNPNLKEDEFKKIKLSSLIAGVRLYSQSEQNETLQGEQSKLTIWRDTYSKKLSKYYMPILYLRKIIFGLIIVCLGSSGYTQISLITILNIAMALYFILLRPLDSTYENYKGAISEIVMIVFQILVGILISDPETQEESDRINIGWVAISIVSLVILWHTIGIIVDFLKAIVEAIKAMVNKKSSSKVTPASSKELQEQKLPSKNLNKSENPLQSPDRRNGDLEGPSQLNIAESDLIQQSSDQLNLNRNQNPISQYPLQLKNSLIMRTFSKIDESASPLQTRDGTPSNLI